MAGKTTTHKWQFQSRFRRGAFGWRSRPAIQRVKEAVSEIKKVARKDPILAAEGAVRFLEKVSPALEHVDSSFGAIGTAVNRAITELVSVIAKALTDADTRAAWLERLFHALADEAYRRYGLTAHRAGTYLAWFRAVQKKYPDKASRDILADLVALNPGEEGKWFAAAKDAKLFDEAIALVSRAPADPRTLTRAARDFAETQPAFAIEAGIAALRWLVAGYGYEITGADVGSAYNYTMKAATQQGSATATQERIRELVATETFGERFVTKILGRELGIGGR